MAGDPSGARASREGGYTLVVLAIAITVMGILIAAALPKWSHAIQREKEEELISRGIQYAEAIRLFQMRFQRPPTRLEELLETKPRCIRRLWKDPMSEDGKWGIIFVNQNPNLQPQQLPPDPNCPNCPRPEAPVPGEGEENSPNAPPRKGDTVAVGPITGVHSKSHKKSILIFNGRERYDEWHFTVDLLNQAAANRMDAPGGGASVPLGPPSADAGIRVRSLRWLGRPLPELFTQPVNGTMPDGSRPQVNPIGQPQNPRGFHVPPGKEPRRPNNN